MTKKRKYKVHLTPGQKVCSDAMTAMLEDLYRSTRDIVLELETVFPINLSEDSDDLYVCMTNLYWWADGIPNNTCDMFQSFEWNAFVVSIEQITELVNKGTMSLSDIWEQAQLCKLKPFGEFEAWERISEPDDLSLDNFVHYILKDCCDNMFGHPMDFDLSEFDYGDEYFHKLTPEILKKCEHFLDNPDVQKANLEGNVDKEVYILLNGFPATYDEILASDKEDEIFIETEDFILAKYKFLPEYFYGDNVQMRSLEDSYDLHFCFGEFFDRMTLAYSIAKRNNKSDEEFLKQFRNMYDGWHL